MSSAWFYPLFMFIGIETATLFTGFVKIKLELHPTIARKICHQLLVLSVYLLFIWLNEFPFSTKSSFMISLFGGFASSFWAILFILPSFINLKKYPALIQNIMKYHLNGFLRDPNASFTTISIEVTRPMVIGSFMNSFTVFMLWKYGLLHYLSLIFIVMAFGDGFGELIPSVLIHVMKFKNIHQYKYWDPINKEYHTKSLEGNIGVLLSTFAFFLYSPSLFCGFSIIFKLFMALIITIVEGISPKGLDNVILFPLSVWIVCQYYCD